MKKPVILHIVSQMQIGGLERGIKHIITHVNAFQHVILVLGEVDLKWIADLPESIFIIALQKKPGQLIRYYPKIWYWINWLKPDIIHTRNLSTLECQGIAWFLGVRARIHGEHGREARDLKGTSLKNQYWRRFWRFFVTYYITVSEEISDYLQKSIKIPASKIDVIPNGANVIKCSPKKTSNQIGMVMRLVAEKSPIDCIKAISQVSHFPIQCDIIGSGPAHQQIEQTIKKHDLSDKICLVGKQYHLQLYYEKWDILVLPSQFEGCSNVLLEAMAAGLIVIASDIAGNRALIQDRVNGLLYPLHQIEKLTACLDLVLSWSHRKRFTMRQAAQKTITEKFSLSRMLNRYEACYTRFVGGCEEV